MSGWAAILGAAQSEDAAFGRACADPRAAQLALLRRILRDNSGCEFGRTHRFDDIDSVETFRERVPIRSYEELRPWIDRVAAGEASILTRDPVVAFEETGGSTSGGKLIPYTDAALLAFRAAVLPWLADLSRRRPGAFAGRAYVAISPATRAPRATAGGSPIGLPSEAAYLGADLAAAFAGVMAVPPAVAGIADVERWRAETLSHLIAARDLTFISVWSPTFLIALIEAIPQFTGKPFDSRAIWPKLDTISAWADGSSQLYARRLRELFPHVHLQGKGLLATEGAVTVPWGGLGHPVPALTSSVIEFIDDAGGAHLCSELQREATYRVVITTPGGLYRYDLGDRVHCHAVTNGLPQLEFVGRANPCSDLVGEKLTEEFVTSALDILDRPSCLVARAAGVPFYELLVETTNVERLGPVSDLVERRLCTNPQYAYAREIGQLGSIRTRAVPNLLERIMAAQARRGRRLADIKPPSLICDPHLRDSLTKEVDSGAADASFAFSAETSARKVPA